jgi:hypothetical protein
MEFVWNDRDADIGTYECALFDDDGSKLDEITFKDYTNAWVKQNDKEYGYKRPYSFEVNCGSSRGFDHDEGYRSKPGGGYQGVSTHTVDDIKRWCEEYLAQKYIDVYEEMLSRFNTAKRRAECLKNMGYGADRKGIEDIGEER